MAKKEAGTFLYLRICDNCLDYDRRKRICMIRFTIEKGGKREPLKRYCTAKGCEVFTFK